MPGCDEAGRDVKRTKQHKPSTGPTIEALAGALFALAPSYLFMESVLASTPHPAHWVGTAIGVAGGYLAGSLFAAWKEANGR